MNSETLPTGVRLGLGPDDVHHYFCCDPDLALCGYQMDDEWDCIPPEEDPDDDCALCVMLLDDPCPTCEGSDA